MPVTAPADKRFRRAYLKPARKRLAWSSWRWPVLAALAVLGVAGFAAHRAMKALVGLDLFERFLEEGQPDATVYADDVHLNERGMLRRLYLEVDHLKRVLPDPASISSLAVLGIRQQNTQ